MNSTLALVILFTLTSVGCSKVGRTLPLIDKTTIAGKHITHESLRGKITVIKIWATWCGPCLAEIPELNELVELYKNDSNVVFLAITDDSHKKIADFLQNREFNYQHITDAKDLKNALQPGLIKYIPQHIVVDQNLNIIFDESEPRGSIKDTLLAVIKQLR